MANAWPPDVVFGLQPEKTPKRRIRAGTGSIWPFELRRFQSHYPYPQNAGTRGNRKTEQGRLPGSLAGKSKICGFLSNAGALL